jgi:hypothetical protein
MASNNQNLHLSDFSLPSTVDNETEINDDEIIQSEPNFLQPPPMGAISRVIAKMGVFDGDYDEQNE